MAPAFYTLPLLTVQTPIKYLDKYYGQFLTYPPLKQRDRYMQTVFGPSHWAEF